MATIAKITPILFNRHVIHPLRHSTTVPFSLLHSQKPTFSLLKTHSQFHTISPLFCSFQENINLNNNFDDEFKENEETPDSKIAKNEENEEVPENKIPKMVEKEVPQLTIKEKKELCSYANSLGDKLKSQQIGKSGVTDNVVFALNETLEANELLKLKIHRSCPGEMDDVVSQLERATGSVVVGQIGRTVIFYRPSLTILGAQKKKEQARKLYAKKREKAQAAFMEREKSAGRPRGPGRGLYGNRRSEKIVS